MKKLTLILLLSLLITPAVAQEISAVAKQKYDNWIAQCKTLPRDTMNPSAYTSLDSFEEIIQMGEEAMPMIQDRIINYNIGFDYLLAFAVIKIRNWNIEDFAVKGAPTDTTLGAAALATNISSYLMDEWMSSPEETLRNRKGTDWPYPGKTSESATNTIK